MEEEAATKTAESNLKITTSIKNKPGPVYSGNFKSIKHQISAKQGTDSRFVTRIISKLCNLSRADSD